MNGLLELTLRGSLMFGVVAALDWLLGGRVNARARRAWWLLVPLAFLITIRLPVLPPAAARILTWTADSAPTPHAVGQARAFVEDWQTPVLARAANPLRSAPLAMLLLAAGAACYGLVPVVRSWSAVRRWSRERLCTDARLLELLEDCKQEAGVTVPVGLVVSATVGTPVILGWLRPRILLPPGLVASLSPEQLRGVLFHELAHFRALDVPLNWLFTLVCALHWFNPAAHLAFRHWSRFCEEAADEAAIAFLRQPSGTAYGETLLHVLRETSGQRPSFTALGVVESVGQLRKRLTMIKHYPQKSPHALLTGTLSLLAASCILLHPVRAADAPWGEVIDPDKDCHLVFTGDQLTISVPGKDHALASEVNRMNAPRVLKEISGDFVAEVKVSGDYPKDAASVVPEFAAWQGAGLLLWQDANNFVRFERAQILSKGQAVSYAVFELRADGAVARYSDANEHRLTGDASYLKLERHGNQLSASVSPDGVKWTALRPMDVPWPKSLEIGVSASHCTNTPLNAELDGFKVTPVEKN